MPSGMLKLENVRNDTATKHEMKVTYYKKQTIHPMALIQKHRLIKAMVTRTLTYICKEIKSSDDNRPICAFFQNRVLLFFLQKTIKT